VLTASAVENNIKHLIGENPLRRSDASAEECAAWFLHGGEWDGTSVPKFGTGRSGLLFARAQLLRALELVQEKNSDEESSRRLRQAFAACAGDVLHATEKLEADPPLEDQLRWLHETILCRSRHLDLLWKQIAVDDKDGRFTEVMIKFATLCCDGPRGERMRGKLTPGNRRPLPTAYLNDERTRTVQDLLDLLKCPTADEETLDFLHKVFASSGHEIERTRIFSSAVRRAVRTMADVTGETAPDRYRAREWEEQLRAAKAAIERLKHRSGLYAEVKSEVKSDAEHCKLRQGFSAAVDFLLPVNVSIASALAESTEKWLKDVGETTSLLNQKFDFRMLAANFAHGGDERFNCAMVKLFSYHDYRAKQMAASIQSKLVNQINHDVEWDNDSLLAERDLLEGLVGRFERWSEDQADRFERVLSQAAGNTAQWTDSVRRSVLAVLNKRGGVSRKPERRQRVDRSDLKPDETRDDNRDATKAYTLQGPTSWLDNVPPWLPEYGVYFALVFVVVFFLSLVFFRLIYGF
jgi:hypothetical protein